MCRRATWVLVVLVLHLLLAGTAGDACELFLPRDRVASVLRARKRRPELPDGCAVEPARERGERLVCTVEPVVLPVDSLDLAAARVHVLGGVTVRTNNGPSYGLLVGIDHQITDLVSLELDYSNEGHFSDSHRDRIAVPVFLTARSLEDRLRWRIGVGPSVFFDSTAPEVPDDFDEQHGFSIVGDAGVEMLLGWSTSLEARVRATKDFEGHSVVQALFGISCELPRPKEPPREEKPWTVAVSGGKSIRVGGTAPSGTAVVVAVSRDRIVSVLGAMAAFVRLGNVDDRNGGLVAPTIRARYLTDGRLSLEVATGPYFYGDGVDHGQPTTGVQAAFLAKAGYRVLGDWELSATVGRFAAFSGEGDSDLLVLGVGYVF